MPELKTIKVTGKGKLKVRPDMTRISITIGGVKKDYAAALKKSSDDTRALQYNVQSISVHSLQRSLHRLQAGRLHIELRRQLLKCKQSLSVV